MPVQQLKKFDELYGWIIRWILVLVLAGIVYFADSRYLTREEVETKEIELYRIRQEDLNLINARIDAHKSETLGVTSVLGQVLERLSSIEAQNVIMLRQIERLQDKTERTSYGSGSN